MTTVNKFGHYLGNEGKMGPPGVGFLLTAEGNYDLQNRILANVKDPDKDQDVVTFKTLKRKIEKTLQLDGSKKAFSCRDNRITDVKHPEKEADAINLAYLKEKTLNCASSGSYYDAKNKLLTNLKWAEKETDAVNLAYLKEKTLNCVGENFYDTKSRRVRGLPNKPDDPTEAVSAEYLTNMVKQIGENTICLREGGFDAKDIVIRRVGFAEAKNDAVNLSLLKAMLKILAYYVQKDLADAVIELRREIHHLRKEKPPAKEIETHLNSIEDSFMVDWRSVLQTRKPAKIKFTPLEKKQIADFIRVQESHLNYFLENE